MPMVKDDVGRAAALLALHEALSGTEHDLPALLHTAALATAALLGDAAGCWQIKREELELASFVLGTHDITDHLRQIMEPCPEQSVLYVAIRERQVVVANADEVAELVGHVDDRFQESVDAFAMTAFAAAPLMSRDVCIGALAVARTEGSPDFDDADIAFLKQLARVVAVTAANATLLEEVEQTRQQANALAREDQLTGLLNRRGFLELLREAPLDRSALVAVFDMDGFRLVNDGFGHTVGDLVLASLAARLCASLPPLTPVARIGSDEFAALVEADDEEEVTDVVQNAVRECTGTFQVVGLSVPVTVSVGTAVPEPGRSDQVLQHADLAMARAKSRGGIVAAYDPTLDDPATRRLRDVLELRRAILGDGLVVHYQPVVPVVPGPPRVEALVRRKVGNALQPPGAWLDIADRSGLMPELTANVVGQVVAQLVQWWDAGLEVECAVNVPAPVLAQPELVRELLRLVDEAGLPRRSLSVEVTEGDLVGPQARDALSRCADADIGVAVDDFGTGWSSLAYLVDLPLRTLKLDRTIVDGVHLDRRRATVMRAVVDVAHDLGLRVVAEGVETQEVADVVIDLGADALQGYLYSRPAAPEDLAPLLRTGLVAARH